MTFISYAQNQEDVMLWRALKHIKNGFYIDVGASDPTFNSVTKAFYDSGWRGINIEPVPTSFDTLQKERPLDINLPCALGATRSEVDIWEPNVIGWATTSADVAELIKASGYTVVSYKVAVETLTEVCEKYGTGDIHFLKIDVEGQEKSVLEGMDFSRFRPWILVIEAITPITNESIFETYEDIVLAAKYKFVCSDGINRFYVANEHPELMDSWHSPNVFDGYLKADFVDLTSQLNLANARSAELEIQVASLRRSFWLIIAVVKSIRLLMIKTKTSIVAFLKKIILFVIRLLTRVIDKRIRLKKWIVKKLIYFPAIDSRLRRIAANQRIQTEKKQPETCLEIPFEISHKVDFKTPTEKFYLPKCKGERYLYIYVDHTVDYHSNTGVQRITRTLARGLIDIGEKVRFVRLDPDSQQCVLINIDERKELSKWNGPNITKDEFELYSTSSEKRVIVEPVPQGENHWIIIPEIPHTASHKRELTLELIMWAKRSNLKTGFIFYDAIPLYRKEMLGAVEDHSRYMQHLLLADVVWPISYSSEADLISYWSKSESADEKTMPELLTCSLPVEIGSERVEIVEPGEAFILSVGSITPHKNQTLLVDAFLRYCKKNPQTQWKLLLAGHLSAGLAMHISKACKTGFVKYLSNVSDSQLLDLYHKCGFTVFPSVLEGFGLPILESLWAGKPCICANFGSMEEVARGGGCLTTDTKDVTAIENAISTLINDKDLRNRLSVEAIKRKIKKPIEYAIELSNYIDNKGLPINDIGVIYYWIESTLSSEYNTGIQRVSRQLARAWLEIGVKLIPVKWGNRDRPIAPASKEDLEFFSRWNGPSVSGFSEWIEPSESTNGWFFMSELPINTPPDKREKIIQFAKSKRLKTASIFFDAIPWKMKEIYPPHYQEAHKDYMMQLYDYDIVLPISNFSAIDLIRFLSSHHPRPQALRSKIKAVPLAEGFPESSQNNKQNKELTKDVNILSVGTIEPRKNHEVLLKGFLTAADRLSKLDISLKLKMVGCVNGPGDGLAERVKQVVDSNSNISWEKNADDTKLKELYQECDFTVYPSLEEGFGLPIAESLRYGKPCISANFGAMKEISDGGGVLSVNVADTDLIAESIVRLASDKDLLKQLTVECFSRKFKTWHDYATEVLLRMHNAISGVSPRPDKSKSKRIIRSSEQMNISKRPKLSVCISTYNRAEWLAVSLQNLIAQHPEANADVELLVCDNASTDHTSEVVKPYLSRPDFSYHKNVFNVGMLGNLRKTVDLASGEYIWILGDDDFLIPGAITRVLRAINEQPKVALIYLNYAYTKENDARNIKNITKFFKTAIPIVPAEQDKYGFIREICAQNENFFTAIYTLVFRRDHAILAYSQNTFGRPFSSMLTCIPTTYHVLNRMMNERGVWIGTPQLVVNMNVSWMKYAPLWILERIPEVYELAEQKGVRPEVMDRWWAHTLPSTVHFFEEIYKNDPLNNAEFFSPEIFVSRFKHLPEFKNFKERFKKIYQSAHDSRHPAAILPTKNVFT